MENQIVAPPPWLVTAFFSGALALILGAMIVIAGIKRVLRGESFFIPRERDTSERSRLRPRPTRVRSTALTPADRAANNVPQRSARQNAESQSVQPVRAVANVQTVQPPKPMHVGDIPINVDEMQRLALTIALYARRPNKELAIKEAWGESKGGGPGYERASLLFDTAMTEAARAAIKQKGAPLAREPELEMA